MSASYIVALVLAAISWILFFTNFGFSEMYGWLTAAVGWTSILLNKKP